MKNPPEKSTRAPASKKRGRPKGITKEERLCIENNIMGQFAPDYDQESNNPAYSDEDFKIMKFSLMANKKGAVSTEEIQERINLQLQKDLLESLTRKRISAMSKLGFIDKGEEKNIKLDKLLQKIIPKVDKDLRRALMAEALGLIIPVFAQRFHIDGEGWPASHLSSLLENEPNNIFYDRIKTEEDDGHVTFKTALTISIYTLAWYKIKSSPKTRGSLGIKKRESNLVENPDKTNEEN